MKKTTAFSTLALLGTFAATSAQADFSITVLHNNDGESGLFADDQGIGGVAKFKTLFDATKSFYESIDHGVVSVYAGDTFLAGPEFQASLDSGDPGSRTFYDALAISQIGYDASIIGNHEFDFGPDVLSEFIVDAQTTNPTTYLSANLDLSGEFSLSLLQGLGLIAPSKTVEVDTAAGTKTVGIIGATTENLPFITSPGAVTAGDVVSAVNTEVANLKAAGADVIILGSHLQGISEDQAIVPSLSSDIDLIIAGGGDELLADLAAPAPISIAPDSVVETGLAPGDDTEGVYPNVDTSIPIVTTTDQYAYLGRVTLNFDDDGNFLGLDDSSNPQLNGADIPADAGVTESIQPVQDFVDALASEIIGNTSVNLLHGGSNTIRSQETNLGSLVADAQRTAAFDTFGGLDFDRLIGIANGGGIREDIDGTDISRLNTFDTSPFGNFVSVLEDMSVADLVLTLENAVSRVIDADPGAGIDPQRQGGGTGRFAQVSGFSFVYDINAQALELDGDGNILTDGSRIVEIILDDGTVLVENGEIVAENEDVLLDLVLPSFNARGGDQYNGAYLSQIYDVNVLTITDQQALQAYFESFNNEDIATVLGGEYSNPDGAGRITAVPEPSSLALLGLGGLLIARRRRSA